jgi:methyltransferase (TIGR00027 family)
MRDEQSSRTAEYMAFFRALETTQPPTRRLFDDPYAFTMLSGPLKILARIGQVPILGGAVHSALEFGWPYTRSSGVVRTRAIDDLVCEAIHAGAQQLVLLGAGFDSRGYRLKEALDIPVFEVDHPATQRAKRERLAAYMGRLPVNVRYVPVDFERGNLEKSLIETGFDPSVSAVVVWEGVISYLTESAVEGTLALLKRLLSSSSWLILTYMHKGALDGTQSFPGARRWRSWVSLSGEPFIFGFDPGTLSEALEPFGFRLQSDESTEQIARRYCPPLNRNEPGSPAYRVATAIRMEF